MQFVSSILTNYPLISIYLLVINSITLFAYGLDKLLARSHSHRISERMLLGLALAGGSLGALIGIKLFRHKTRKDSFLILMAIILLIQIALAALLLHPFDRLLTPPPYLR